MHLLPTLTFLLVYAIQAFATILENGNPRVDPYPGQAPNISLDDSWRSYGPNASEIAYKGRWDSNYVSCMSPFFWDRVAEWYWVLIMADRVVVCFLSFTAWTLID